MILCSPHGKVARCQLFFFGAETHRRIRRKLRGENLWEKGFAELTSSKVAARSTAN